MLALEARVAALEKTNAEAEKAAPPATESSAGLFAIGARDGSSPADARICIRGETNNLGPAVTRGVVSLVQVPHDPSIPSDHSGRLELAQWVASPRNPLTAPRGGESGLAAFVWPGIGPHRRQFRHHRRSADASGTARFPADGFVKDGWSTKRLVKSLVLSRAYRLAGTYDAADAAADPANHLIWRSSPRRLEAEAIRDAMLAASGQLDLARPEGSRVKQLPEGKNSVNNDTGNKLANGARYRSVYLPILRDAVPAVLDIFDFAEPTLVTGSRDVTTVPTHALFLMNNPFVLEQSSALASRVLEAPLADDAARIDYAYQLTLGRKATSAERSRVAAYLADYQANDMTAKKAPEKVRVSAWASACQALFASGEFRYVR